MILRVDQVVFLRGRQVNTLQTSAASVADPPALSANAAVRSIGVRAPRLVVDLAVTANVYHAGADVAAPACVRVVGFVVAEATRTVILAGSA
jgi:hypothetical protein